MLQCIDDHPEKSPQAIWATSQQLAVSFVNLTCLSLGEEAPGWTANVAT